MSASFWPVTLVDYAEIIGAFATAAAVIVSLMLAYKKPRPVLDVELAVVVHVAQGMGEALPQFLQIRVTNMGGTEGVLTSVGWCVKPRWPWGKTSWGYQDVSGSGSFYSNPPLPLRLSHGEAVSFLIPAHGQDDWFENIRQRGFFSERIRVRKDLHKLRLIATSSVGTTVYRPLKPEFLDRLWKSAQSYRQRE